MDIAERRDHLLLVVDHLLAVHRAWVESDTPYITDDLERVVDETIEVFANGAIPADCRELNGRVETLGRHWKAYKVRAAVRSDPSFLPDNGFWKAIELVMQGRHQAEPQPRRMIESVAELTRQNVSDRQICLIYGWMDGKGQPELWKVQEERAKPGTHTGEGFVSPIERQQQEREQRQRQIVADIQQRQQRKLERLSTPAPEGLESLIEQGVSAKQIASMMHCTVEQIFETCRERGLPIPREAYDLDPIPGTVAEKQVRREPAVRPISTPAAEENVDPVDVVEDLLNDLGGGQRDENEADGEGDMAAASGMTIEQEIIHLHRQQMDAAAIASAVNVPVKRVRSVLRQWENNPEIFEAIV